MNLKEKFKDVDIKLALKNVSMIIIGTVILAIGTAIFILPFNLVIGGVSGLGIIISRFIPWEFFTVDVVITILTWLLFFLGFFILGRSFAAKTLVSTIIYPPAISIFMKMASPNFLDGFFLLNTGSDMHLLLAAIFGGVLIGIGCAITFLGGGSTGGSDIIGFIIAKFIKKLKSSMAIGCVDGAIVILGMFFLDDFILTLVGVLSVFITTIVVDKVFIGASKAFVAQIVTENYEGINKAVIEELERTTSIMDIIGGYSGEKKKMVMVSFSMRQYANLLSIINKCDKNAFITIHRAHEINGEGWTR